MSSVEITNKSLTEANVIVWKIPDFSQVHKTKSQSATAESIFRDFYAGECVGRNQKCTWKLELKFLPGNEHIGLYLHLSRSPVIRNVKARFCGSVQVTEGNADKLFLSKDTDVKEYKEDVNRWGFEEFVTMDKLKVLGALLNNDILTINVKLIIEGDSNTTAATPISAQEILKQNAVNQMVKYFGGLLETGEGSDLVIRVKDLKSGEYVEKKASRNILSSQSSVFEAMLGSPMSEKGTGVVTIEDLTPKGLDVLLEFIYTGNLSSDWKLVPEEIANAAEKYNLELLKAFMDEWLYTACTMDNAIMLFTLAKKQGLDKASANILEYIKSNLESLLTQNF